MAPYFSFISFLLVTFLMAQARELPLGEISLEQEPEQSYYIVKKRPAVIVCKARNAVDITFTCAGTQIPPTSVEMEDMSDVDPEVIQAKIEVTRADVQNYDDSQGAFWCECSALDIDGQPAVTSRRSFITVAHLKHRFSSHPQSRQASEGENVEFICGAPVGDPKPEILWRKDKKRLNIKENSRLVVTDQGSLVIESATQEDSGLYQCVAKNPAGRRESKEAKLTVSVYAESSEPAEEVSAGESSESRIRNPRQSEKKTYFSTLPQDSYYIRPDEKVTMECEATAADILTFRCNGQRMQRHQMQTEQGTDNAGNRVIKSVLTVEYADVRDYYSKAGDSSSYACVCVAWYQDATNPRGWGHISSDENVGIVLLSYLDRTFQVEPSDLTVGVNTDAVLLCEPPKGQPSPWVYWFKDRVRLDPRSDDHYSINAKGHLTIHRVQYDDSGVYNCLAENTVDQIQSKRARLIVTAEAPATTAAPVASMEDTIPSFPDQIPDFPVFLNDLKPQYDITSGDRATLVCSVVSADQLTFLCGQARIDSKDLKKSDSQYDNESGKRLLYASYEVTEDVLSGASDDFYCQCTAWYLNADGKWQMLQGNKGFVNLVEGEEREPEPKTYINDDFVYEPTDLTVDFEGEAELACEPPQGYPEPTVYWTKDGVKIKPELDSNFIVLEEGPLIIEYVRLGDEGMYTCVAENSAGSRVSRPMQLTVRGKPTTLPPTTPTTPMTPTPEPTDEDITDGTDLYPTTSDYYDYTAIKLTEPLFSMEPKEASYIVNDLPITLSCSVVAAKSLVFACNDEVVDETVKTGYLTIEPTSQQEIRDNSLTITKEQVEAWTGSDPFSCTCRGYYLAEGAEAGDWSFVESRAGTIQIAFFKKRFMMEPVSQNVQQGEDAELRCKAPAGVPTPTVYWLKDGYRLNEDETVMINEQGSLMIKGFSAKDEGDYTCVAENMLKRRTSKTASIRLAGEQTYFLMNWVCKY
ncbi:hemicentin-1 [Aplysia californica]|uniref:Hemicentin-1 n=1 Tax=Aplysia californica TaxID=6500 RepID=A0ABM0K0G2_APLCA|nr:hemicentin-1 [Aplysia californica]